MLDILATIGFDWRVALANLISFLIIYWLLKRYAFKPMARIIKERQDKIRSGLDNADKAEETLRQAEDQEKGIVKDAKKEAHGIVMSATDQGKNIVDEATTQADKKAKDIVDQAHKQIDIDREAMQSEVHSYAADVVVRGLEKILSKEFDAKQNEEYSKKAIASIK
jgi:F-type H+-transporting ATPase subunit b